VDVGICEQHAVTFAAGLATQGFRPVVAIYSTFLQRSYDQLVHDVCLQNLPVTFCLDRGGLVGEDGPTHHGAFDLSYLRHIPNLVVMAPKDRPNWPACWSRPWVTTVRSRSANPRGVGVGARPDAKPEPLPFGKGELLRHGTDAAVIAIGSRVHPCLAAAEAVAAKTGTSVAVLNARFVKPLPEDEILELAGRCTRLLVVEENTVVGGFGSAVLELLADKDALAGLTVKRLGLPDAFVEHGPQKTLRAKLGIDTEGITRAIEDLLR
jgi:1-deoxy-D-xylulose-5-phosphate synthase